MPSWPLTVRTTSISLSIAFSCFGSLTVVDFAGVAYMIQPVVFTWATKVLARSGDDAARAVTLYAMNGETICCSEIHMAVY